MTQNNNSWRKTYFTLLAGQAISFISSGILQMAIIFYLVAKTNSAIILTAATLIGFLPQACLGPFAGAFVDRHSRKSVMIGADLIIAAAGGILALVAFLSNNIIALRGQTAYKNAAAAGLIIALTACMVCV